MRRFFPHPRMMLLLTVLWLLLVNTLNLGHILLGLFLGWSIVHLCGDFLLTVPKVRKPLGLLLFIGKVFYDIVVANLQVVKLVLGRNRASSRHSSRYRSRSRMSSCCRPWPASFR